MAQLSFKPGKYYFNPCCVSRMKHGLMIPVFMFLFYTLNAQTAERFLNLGLGYHFNTSLDKGMSSLKYKGSGITAILGFHKSKNTTRHYFDIQFDFSSLKPKSKASLVYRYATEISYSLGKAFLKPKWNKFRYWIGGNASIFSAVRYHTAFGNNAYNFDVLLSIGPTGLIERDFKLKKRTITLQYIATLPVLALASRPAFSSPQPESFYENPDKIFQSALQSLELYSWNKFFRFKNQFVLVYPIQTSNVIQLSYTWDYYSISKIKQNKIQSATHMILIMAKFKF
jgi:hypothetical protein